MKTWEKTSGTVEENGVQFLVYEYKNPQASPGTLPNHLKIHKRTSKLLSFIYTVKYDIPEFAQKHKELLADIEDIIEFHFDKDSTSLLVKRATKNQAEKFLPFLKKCTPKFPKEIIEEIEGIIKGATDINVSQTHITNQFIRYLEIDRGKPLSKEEKKIYHAGICFGCSNTYSYMATTGKLAWWKSLLVKFSQWDGKKNSLNKKVTLPQSSSKKAETLNSLFRRAVNYVIFNQVSRDQIGIANLSQRAFLTPKDAWFDSERGKIISNARVAGNFTKTILAKLLKPKLFAQEGICGLSMSRYRLSKERDELSTGRHRNSIFYRDNKWHLYDSNAVAGEKIFSKKEDLIEEIFKGSWDSFCVEISTWDPKSTWAADELSKIYSTLIEQSSSLTEILKGYGLHQIITHAPKTLPKIFKLAEKEEKVQQTLAIFLATQHLDTDGEKITGLQYISYYQPQHMPALLELTKNHKKFQKSLTDIMATLNRYSLPDFSLLDAKQLPVFFELAEKYEYIRQVLPKTLTTKQNKGEITGFQHIFHNAPQQVSALLKLAEKYKTIRQALANTLAMKHTTQYGREFTGFYYFAHSTPKPLPMLLKLAEKYENVRQGLRDAIVEEKGKQAIFSFIRKTAKNRPEQLSALLETVFDRKGLTNFYDDNARTTQVIRKVISNTIRNTLFNMVKKDKTVASSKEIRIFKEGKTSTFGLGLFSNPNSIWTKYNQYKINRIKEGAQQTTSFEKEKRETTVGICQQN